MAPFHHPCLHHPHPCPAGVSKRSELEGCDQELSRMDLEGRDMGRAPEESNGYMQVGVGGLRWVL